MRLLRTHRLFGAVIALAAALRLTVLLGYPPARLFNSDSYDYLALAVHVTPSAGFRPSGYPFFLWALRPFHSLALIATLQHLMGLAIGVMIYALLRRRGLPAWGAALATIPALFDTQFLWVEHSILADTQFVFLIVTALTIVLWRRDLSWKAATAVGLLLALATMTRTVAAPLLLLFLLYLLLRRASWRTVAALALAGLLPLAGYATWFHHYHGKYALSGVDGVALWARTMTFADCAKIKPPSDEAKLCPAGPEHRGASVYVWDRDASINRLPRPVPALDNGEITPEGNALAKSFATHAILAQPLDYLADVLHETSLTFAWTPADHPEGAALLTKPFYQGYDIPQQFPTASAADRDYADKAGETRSVRPFSTFMVGYQEVMSLPGTFLAAIFLIGLWGAVRRGLDTLLTWTIAAALLVLPIATLSFDHRYVLPAVPLAALAAGMAFVRRPRTEAPSDHGETDRTQADSLSASGSPV